MDSHSLASADRIAVVGTDTGVGKTVITAAITAQLRAGGVDARAVKPAQTGYPPDDDAGFVAEACDSDEASVCFKYLEEPLAPRVAAERAGVDISYERLREQCDDALEAAETGVLEGIGGLYVPLADDRTVLDLVSELDCSAVVVARSGLGTLNHTTLTVRALENAGISVRAILLNEYDGETVAERTNRAELERLTGYPVSRVPTVDANSPRELVDSVRQSLEELV